MLGGKAAPISTLKYIYSSDGMIAGRVVAGKFQMYSYDKRGQLLRVADMQGNVAENYVYDPAGNILSKTIDGKTTTYTYDKANQLVSSTTDGKVTEYAYDAAGRLIKEGDKSYSYGWLDKVLSVTENGQQIAQAIHNGKSEDFLWDGLALIHRGETSFINEPYVTGGNPILSSKDGVMFNDMLGSTLNIGGKAVNMTAFGESADSNAMYTGRPYIGELGYAFLFRNYRSDYGKWQTTDLLGYPDGWNNLAYCNNGVTVFVDWLGAATIALHGRPVKNTFGTFIHTSTHINVNQQEYDSCSKEKQSKFTKLPDGSYRSIVSGFDSGGLLNPKTNLDLRFNDPSDETATFISNITNPKKNAMQLTNDYLDQAMKYEQHETETDYDWFPNNSDEGNCNALQGTILRCQNQGPAE